MTAPPPLDGKLWIITGLIILFYVKQSQKKMQVEICVLHLFNTRFRFSVARGEKERERKGNIPP